MGVQTFDQMLQLAGMKINGDQYVEDFAKALGTNNSGPGGHQSGPLMLENLDAMMTEVLINESHIKLFNRIPKVPSAQPYYEYNVHKGFGSSRRGGAGFAQGGAPNGGVSSFERKGIYNKYLGVQGGVTHQMMIAGQNGGSFEDPVVRENRDRTLELLDKVEREMFFGSKGIKDANGEEVNFDGLLTQLTADYASNVVDMKGAALTFDEMDKASEGLVTDGKQATVSGYQALGSVHVMSGLNRQFASRNLQRFNKDLSVGQVYTPGSAINNYDTNFGTINLDHSIMLEEVETSMPATVAPAGSPATPAITTQPAQLDEAAGMWVAGTYYYTVAAFNDIGESLGIITDGIVVPDDTTKVTTVVTRVTGATGYRIYRGRLADGSDHKWIAKVAQPESGNLTFVDLGAWRTQSAAGLAENGLCILYKPEPRDLVIAQMSPLMKMPLPIAGTTFPFLLLLYLVPVIKAPQRIKIFKNCGTYTPA